METTFSLRKILYICCGSMMILFAFAGPTEAWQPTRPIEFIIPAGAGGGADLMARFIFPLVEKHKLSPQPLIVINKSGGAGAEGLWM